MSKVASYGWDVFLYINGAQVPANQISGPIKIVKIENDASSLSFVLKPPRGVLAIQLFEGMPVQCNIQTPNGYYRSYTGRIETAEVNFNTRMIDVTCTDNRRELINTTLGTYIKSIG